MAAVSGRRSVKGGPGGSLDRATPDSIIDKHRATPVNWKVFIATTPVVVLFGPAQRALAASSDAFIRCFTPPESVRLKMRGRNENIFCSRSTNRPNGQLRYAQRTIETPLFSAASARTIDAAAIAAGTPGYTLMRRAAGCDQCGDRRLAVPVACSPNTKSHTSNQFFKKLFPIEHPEPTTSDHEPGSVYAGLFATPLSA